MRILVAGVLFVLLLAGCERRSIDGSESCSFANLESGSSAVSITQGIYGLVSFTEGNCMPGIGLSRSCRTCPVKRTVRFYDVTSEADAVRSVKGGSFYTNFRTRLVAEAESDINGFYQISLPPGNYTMVVVEDGDLYASFFEGNGQINPITVNAGTKRLDFSITYKAVY